MIPKFTLSEVEKSAAKSLILDKTIFIPEDLTERELPYVENYNNDVDKPLAERLDDIDYSRLEFLLQGEYYNPEVLKLFSRILVAIYRNEPETGAKVQMVHHWLKKVETLSQGAFGLTLEATLRGMVSPDVILKYSINSDDNLIHEIFVGLFGTNKLREYIPNFSFVYGGFPCSEPIIYNDKVLTFCNTNYSSGSVAQYYALYENVTPSRTLHEVQNNLTPHEFLNIFFQLCLAEEFAYEQINFTHFDLHTGNLLIRELDEEILLRYSLDKHTYYVRTKYIVTFIDYGYSSISYRGVQYYLPRVPLFLGLGKVSTFPLYDMFRLLSTIYLNSFGTSKEALVKKIMHFFTDEDLTYEGKFYDFVNSFEFAQPLPTRYSKYSVQPLIDFLVQLSPTSLVSGETHIDRFYCTTCKDMKDLEQELLLTKEPKPNSLIQYYLLYMSSIKYEDTYPEFKIISDLRKLKKNIERYNSLISNPPSLKLKNVETQKEDIYRYLHYVSQAIVLERHILFMKRVFITLGYAKEVRKLPTLLLQSIDLPSTLEVIGEKINAYQEKFPQQKKKLVPLLTTIYKLAYL